MSVTLIGKVLVFTVLAFSLLFAGLALGLYTNRINWPGSPQSGGPGDKVEGELAKREEEVKQLKDSVERSRKRWQANRDALAAVEAQRPQVQVWYDEQLNILKTGKDRAGNAVQPPVKALVFENGQLKPDRTGSPAFIPLELTYLDDVNRQLKDTEREIEKTLKETEALLKTLKGRTQEIQAVRALVGEEDTARRNALAELKYLEPSLYNYEVESQTLVKRQRALSARLQQLRNLGVASRP